MNTENEILGGDVSEDAASTNSTAPNNEEAQTQTSEAAPSEAAPTDPAAKAEIAPAAVSSPDPVEQIADPEAKAETVPNESAPAAESSTDLVEQTVDPESVPKETPAAKTENPVDVSPTTTKEPAAAATSPLADVPYDYVYIINNPLVSAHTELVQLPNGKAVEVSNTMTIGDALIAAGIFLLISFQVLKFLLEAATRRR